MHEILKIGLKNTEILFHRTDHSLTFRICKPKCTEGQTCVRKCCLLSETLEFKTTASGIITQACVPAAPAQWQPVVYKNLELPFGAGNSNSLVHIQVEGTGEWNMSECREIAKYTYKGSLRSEQVLISYFISYVSNGEKAYFLL